MGNFFAKVIESANYLSFCSYNVDLPKIIDMKKVLIGLIVLVLIVVAFLFLRNNNSGNTNDGPNQEAIKEGSHSATFNSSIDTMLANYFTLTDAFVNADSIKVKVAGENLAKSFNTIPLVELKKDTTAKSDAVFIYSADSATLATVRSVTDSMINGSNLAAMRKNFSDINQNLYSFLKGINYNGKKLYWYNCPMAFGEDNSANWLSYSEEKMNPYLGLHHPEYKSAMVHCGELQDSIMSK
jgi:hypothetical protein